MGERFCRGVWWTGVDSREAGVTPRKAQGWGLAATEQTNKGQNPQRPQSLAFDFFLREETKVQEHKGLFPICH